MVKNRDRTLGMRQAAGYGVGDFAMNLYWGALSYFLLYWYTDVAGLPPAVAGFVFFAGTFWDAVTDPTIGFLVGRTRSRFGRYRPYLLFGSVPLAAAFALLFWVPPLRDTALIAALLAAHLLFRTAYTLVAIPYSSLSARISTLSADRTTLASARMIAATAGALLVSSAGFPLVNLLGRGEERGGFFYLALLAGATAVIFHLVCFAATREPVDPADSARPGERKYELRDLARIVRSNTAFLYLLMMIPLLSIAAALLQKSLVYFVKYGLSMHEQQHIVLFAHGLLALLATPLWAYVAQTKGRRHAWYLSTALMTAGAFGMFVYTPGSLLGFLAMLTPISISFAAMGLLYWSMLPDTIEYGEWRSGYRAESVFFGVASFAQKLSIGVAGWALGGALAIVGFVPDVQQSVATITTIKANMTLLPAACLIVTCLIVSRYPLNATLHQQIRSEIGRPRDGG